MDREAEIIRQEMSQTREALVEKLEMVEDHIVDTVHDAVSNVGKTIENVTQTVEDTVAAARNSVQETKAAIRDTLDLKHHVESHPWAALGASVTAGYLVGHILHKSSGSSSKKPAPRVNGYYAPESRMPAASEGGLSRAYGSEVAGASATAPASDGKRVDGNVNKFASEIDRLKGLGIGMICGLVRDMISQSVPEHLATGISEVIDSVTLKLGGEPIPGPVLPGITADLFHTKGGRHEDGNPTEMGGPVGATCR